MQPIYGAVDTFLIFYIFFWLKFQGNATIKPLDKLLSKPKSMTVQGFQGWASELKHRANAAKSSFTLAKSQYMCTTQNTQLPLKCIVAIIANS